MNDNNMIALVSSKTWLGRFLFSVFPFILLTVHVSRWNCDFQIPSGDDTTYHSPFLFVGKKVVKNVSGYSLIFWKIHISLLPMTRRNRAIIDKLMEDDNVETKPM